jgi:hypothetical protein
MISLILHLDLRISHLEGDKKANFGRTRGAAGGAKNLKQTTLSFGSSGKSAGTGGRRR